MSFLLGELHLGKCWLDLWKHWGAWLTGHQWMGRMYLPLKRWCSNSFSCRIGAVTSNMIENTNDTYDLWEHYLNIWMVSFLWLISCRFSGWMMMMSQWFSLTYSVCCFISAVSSMKVFSANTAPIYIQIILNFFNQPRGLFFHFILLISHWISCSHERILSFETL